MTVGRKDNDRYPCSYFALQWTLISPVGHPGNSNSVSGELNESPITWYLEISPCLPRQRKNRGKRFLNPPQFIIIYTGAFSELTVKTIWDKFITFDYNKSFLEWNEQKFPLNSTRKNQLDAFSRESKLQNMITWSKTEKIVKTTIV